MVCPFCLHKKTEVYNSRPTKRINGFWRRRRCAQCKKEFTTRETVDAEAILRVTDPEVSKKTMRFSRPRLLLSLLRACDHQSARDNAYWLCDTIEQKLITQAAAQDGRLTTDDIVAVSLEVLKRFDTPAFIKYLTHHSPTIDAKTLKKRLKRS